MNTIPFNQDQKDIVGATQTISYTRFVQSLRMTWQPREDITTYELAMCLPYLLSNRFIMPHEVDENLSHFRHFFIVNPNENK
jgi:hypothetical protein